VAVTASNSSSNSYAGSAAASYVVSSSPLSVGITTNQSSYLPGQTVGINVTLLYGTVPDAGAGVAVTITSPRGGTTTLSGTTASNGTAQLSYKLSSRALAGTYQVQYGAAAVTKSSGGRTTAAATSAVVVPSTSFTVQ
jgi:uncharacterized protein YfaS (alpha-2-macroglobulin family)